MGDPQLPYIEIMNKTEVVREETPLFQEKIVIQEANLEPIRFVEVLPTVVIQDEESKNQAAL